MEERTMEKKIIVVAIDQELCEYFLQLAIFLKEVSQDYKVILTYGMKQEKGSQLFEKEGCFESRLKEIFEVLGLEKNIQKIFTSVLFINGSDDLMPGERKRILFALKKADILLCLETPYLEDGPLDKGHGRGSLLLANAIQKRIKTSKYFILGDNYPVRWLRQSLTCREATLNFNIGGVYDGLVVDTVRSALKFLFRVHKDGDEEVVMANIQDAEDAFWGKAGMRIVSNESDEAEVNNS
jgi:hypothetical protein